MRWGGFLVRGRAWGRHEALVAHEGYNKTITVILCPVIISIHAPAWGATRADKIISNASSYFNPRPRVGGDLVDGLHEPILSISIHAPVRGATPSLSVIDVPPSSISIHAHAWGATAHYVESVLQRSLSIHAPAQGRPPRYALSVAHIIFQSTPCVGGDVSRS